MGKRVLISFLIGFCLISPLLASRSGFAADLTVDEIISKLQANQSAIKDMSADTVTKITSTMKGAKDIIQKGMILTKYPDKSRTETFSPMHQIMITNGDRVIIINKESGQKTEQNLPAGASGQMNLEKIREQFDFSVKKNEDDYTIVGIPKGDNKFLGRMEISIDLINWLTKRVKIFTSQGKIMSESTMEYSKIADIWVLSKTVSSASTPLGNMKMEMICENIKINQGIKDSAFKY